MSSDIKKRLGNRLWQHRQEVEGSKKHRAKSRVLSEPKPWQRYSLLRMLLKATGIFKIANQQFLSPVLEHNTFSLADLPDDLDGYTILHLSDFHIDLDPSLGAVIQNKIQELTYDLCVLTGDFQYAFAGKSQVVTGQMHSILKKIKCPAYAIAGNHDTIEIIEALEAIGLPFLLNENTPIRHNRANLYLCGIDDPIYYQTHDLVKARKGIPADAVSLLLSHAPTTAPLASELGYSLQISGHTHGGQLCLPGGFPICRGGSPLRQVKGPWKQGRLMGYTSRGVGASHLRARLFCPPEITLHYLRKA